MPSACGARAASTAHTPTASRPHRNARGVSATRGVTVATSAIAAPASNTNGSGATQPRPNPSAETIEGWKNPLRASRVHSTVSVS